MGDNCCSKCLPAYLRVQEQHVQTKAEAERLVRLQLMEREWS